MRSPYRESPLRLKMRILDAKAKARRRLDRFAGDDSQESFV